MFKAIYLEDKRIDDENRIFSDDRPGNSSCVCRKASSLRPGYISRVFISTVRDGNVRGHCRSSLSPSRYPQDLFIYRRVPSSTLDIGTTNDKMFRALKREISTRGRPSARAYRKKWALAGGKGDAWFYARLSSPLLPLLSPCLFLPLLVFFIFIIRWARHRSNDRRKRTAGVKKEKRVESRD